MSRALGEASPGAVEPTPATSTRPGIIEPPYGRSTGHRACEVCGRRFHTRRPDARSCSGRCRMRASRQRRLHELHELEVRLGHAEGEARIVLARLRELAGAGVMKVAS